MKLQKLTIHNIASIEDAGIDFEAEPLSGSDVFLITGKTGSGKSTILDAICLALYANTPRLENTHMQGKITDAEKKEFSVADPKHLLRRNTGEGFVELTFTGNDGKHYKTKWEVHRKNKKVDGPLQDSSWNLTKLDEDNVLLTKVKVIEQEIAKVVGLTFEQFCRTTLLAQGEFTRFLNSNDKDKADILEKITGTEIYKKIGGKIYEMTAAKKTLADNAAMAVGNITLLTDEKIAEKKAKIADCDTRYEALKTERGKADAKLKWIEKEAELENAITTVQQTLSDANEVVKSAEFKEKDLLVTQWNTTINARSWLTEQKKTEAEKVKQQGKLDMLKANYLKILAGYTFEEQKKREFNDELSKLSQVDEEEGRKAQEELEELNKQFVRAKGLQGNIKIAEERIGQLAEKKQRRQQASQNLENIKNKACEKENAAKKLAQPIKDALKMKNDRQAAFDTQKEVNKVLLQLIRQKVQVGDTCPVCGQPIKDKLPHEDDLTKLIEASDKAYREAENEYNKLVDKRNQLLAEKKAFDDSYNSAKATFDKDTSLADAIQRVTEACKTCDIEVFDETTTPQQLQTLKGKTDDEIEQLNEKKTSVNKKVNTYMETTEKRGKLTKKLAIINNTLDTVKTAVEAIQKDMPEWIELNPQTAAELQGLSANANEVRNDVHTAVSKLSDATVTAADNQSHLNQFLAEHPELTIERLTSLNAVRQADINTLTKDVNDARAAVSRQKGALQQAINNKEEHLKTKPELKEEDSSEKLKLFVEAKDKEMGDVNMEKGGIEQELKTDAENVKKHGKLVKEKERLEAEHNKWDRLNKFIGSSSGDAFNKIAQSYILGSLIHSANHYMQNLYDRYTLKVVPGTFVIMIEDAYQGYASRAVSTISGGESFLVSLALALALSDIGDRLAVDTLFIDEGFGTLSGEPLQHAIDTLRKLHSQSGRHVGIISHVEELKESITTQIQVNQSPYTGSSQIEITHDV